MSAYANQLNRNESDFRHLHINTSDKETLKRLAETSYSYSKMNLASILNFDFRDVLFQHLQKELRIFKKELNYF